MSLHEVVEDGYLLEVIMMVCLRCLLDIVCLMLLRRNGRWITKKAQRRKGQKAISPDTHRVSGRSGSEEYE